MKNFFMGLRMDEATAKLITEAVDHFESIQQTLDEANKDGQCSWAAALNEHLYGFPEKLKALLYEHGFANARLEMRYSENCEVSF